MAIAQATLTFLDSTNGGDVNATSYSPPSTTPTSNALVLLAVYNVRAASTAGIPTVTGNAMTWVQVNTEKFDVNGEVFQSRVTLFRAMSVITTAGAVTIDFGGVTQLGCAASLIEFTGVNTGGTNGSSAVVQSAVNSGEAVSAVTVTLAAFASVNNATYAVFGVGTNTAVNPKAGWTELQDKALSAPVARLEDQWRNANDTTATGTLAAGTDDIGGIAIEIAAAGSADPNAFMVGEAVPVQPVNQPEPRLNAGLTVATYKPSIVDGTITPRGTFQANFDPIAVGWHHEIREDGGYYSAEMSFPANILDLNRWLDSLLLHVELHDHRGKRVFEGFVNEARITVGQYEITVGPLMALGNRVSGVYTPILDATVDPPLTGATQSTTIAENTDSQARYGIIEKILDMGEKTDTVAEQIRDAWLDENAWPDLDSSDATESGSGTAPLEINVQILGYVHWLDAYVFNDATIFSVTTESKIQSVLVADPNNIISTDYTKLDANGSLTSGYENESRFAGDIIRGIVLEADISDDRWQFGIYNDRIAVYREIPTTVEYRRSLFIDGGHAITDAGNTPVYPWEVLPGRWIEYTDFAAGMFVSTALGQSLRTDYIERVTFTAPDKVQIEGQKFSRVTQMLVRNGIDSL